MNMNPYSLTFQYSKNTLQHGDYDKNVLLFLIHSSSGWFTLGGIRGEKALKPPPKEACLAWSCQFSTCVKGSLHPGRSWERFNGTFDSKRSSVKHYMINFLRHRRAHGLSTLSRLHPLSHCLLHSSEATPVWDPSTILFWFTRYTWNKFVLQREIMTFTKATRYHLIRKINKAYLKYFTHPSYTYQVPSMC